MASGRSRRAADLDYSILHKTGEKVLKTRSVVDIENNMATTDADTKTYLLLDLEGCEEAICDFFTEIFLSEAHSLAKIDSNVVELKNLRTEYKRIHRQLKPLIEDYDTSTKPTYDATCENISANVIDDKAEKKTRSDALLLYRKFSV